MGELMNYGGGTMQPGGFGTAGFYGSSPMMRVGSPVAAPPATPTPTPQPGPPRVLNPAGSIYGGGTPTPAAPGAAASPFATPGSRPMMPAAGGMGGMNPQLMQFLMSPQGQQLMQMMRMYGGGMGGMGGGGGGFAGGVSAPPNV